jgi:hypothetical protein
MAMHRCYGDRLTVAMGMLCSQHIKKTLATTDERTNVDLCSNLRKLETLVIFVSEFVCRWPGESSETWVEQTLLFCVQLGFAQMPFASGCHFVMPCAEIDDAVHKM